MWSTWNVVPQIPWVLVFLKMSFNNYLHWYSSTFWSRWIQGKRALYIWSHQGIFHLMQDEGDALLMFIETFNFLPFWEVCLHLGSKNWGLNSRERKIICFWVNTPVPMETDFQLCITRVVQRNKPGCKSCCLFPDTFYRLFAEQMSVHLRE